MTERQQASIFLDLVFLMAFGISMLLHKGAIGPWQEASFGALMGSMLVTVTSWNKR